VLLLPTVADKSFLITIGDRSVGGMTVRDQMVGPWQVPVADCAVTTMSFEGYLGEAMAMGERTPLAVIDAAAPAAWPWAKPSPTSPPRPSPTSPTSSCRQLDGACGQPGQDAALYDTVKAVGMDRARRWASASPWARIRCPCAPTWKDEGGAAKSVTSPVSLIVSSFAPVTDVASLTPQLRPTGRHVPDLIDLGRGKNRLGASALAQVLQQLGNATPDVDSRKT
jgi:phosphoribosylformylglycinamidine synthase